MFEEGSMFAVDSFDTQTTVYVLSFWTVFESMTIRASQYKRLDRAGGIWQRLRS